MIAEVIESGFAFLLGVGVGPLIFRAVVGRSAARSTPRYPCPWTPCGYPLPEVPLVSVIEDDRNWPKVVPEACDGCGKMVVYEPFNRRYVRYSRGP